MRIFSLAVFALLSLNVTAFAQITDKQSRSFEVVQTVELLAPVSVVWETVTGDISGWWDHRFSERPARFFIDARPGGAFLEHFDAAATSGVVHASVIYVDPEKRLTMTGPLGFNGHALNLVINWTFEGVGEDKTRLDLRISASGVYEDGWAQALDAVWAHFLEKRLKGYLNAGCRGGAPCEAFQ